MNPDTVAIHGDFSPRVDGAMVTPIFQSSTYEVLPADDTSGREAVRYMRYSNSPNHDELGAKLARLEGAEAAMVTGSGMAAVSAALLSVLSAGDRVLVQTSLYGGTHHLVTAHLSRLGIEHAFIDPVDRSSWAKACTPNTRAVYVEALSNPLVQAPDLAGVVAFARERGLASIIDATFATPVFLRPVELGFDICLHSATKYLGGHSDLVAGVVSGSRERALAMREVTRAFGGSLDANSCFLLDRGLKTLPLRMARHHENATALAAHLAAHPAVGVVNHPSQQGGDHLAPFAGFGGMLSFELKGGNPAAFLDAVRVATHAASLGGTETLAVSPAMSSHAGLSPEQLAAAGVSDGLVRVSVGLEHIDDLRADFDGALAAAG